MMKHLSAALFAGVLATSSSTVVWSAPPRPQSLVPSALTVLRASTSPPAPAHSVALGPLSPSVELHIDVTLRLPDPSAVTAFIRSLSDRRSASFHHFLRPGQFGQLFGPPPSEVAAVDAVLRSDGLHPGQVTSNRLSIPVTAPASALDRAFHVSLAGYRLTSGRTAFTTLSPPSISAAVAPDIQGVIGLNDLDQPQSLLARSRVARSAPASSREARQTTAGPVPCAPATNAASIDWSYTADRLATYYGMTPLYSLGDFGQGVNIAIAEFEPVLRTDIAAYQACFGTKATVSYIPVDGGAGSGDGGGEAALDIEDAIGLAPRATIDVYQAPAWDESAGGDGGPYVYDLYSAIVNNDTDQVVSTSWGSCELDADSSLISSEQSLFSQAATQGQTVFAAAGDFGSTDCFSDSGSRNEFSLAVDDPASQPYVIGVGGTSIGTDSQTVWNDSTGAGGGGVSAVWCMPSYQDQSGAPGLIGPNSVPDPNDCTTGWAREVPDVSADADPETGYVTYWNGSWQAGEGGTSAGAPLWAAAAALVDSSPFCADYGSKHATATLFGSLYSIADSSHHSDALYDVTNGNNVYPPSGYSGDLYPATKGYDLASGLGTPFLAYPGNYVPGLAAQVCFAYGTKLDTTTITGVSPDEGPTSGSTPVAITGSGFLPIAGADRLEVGAKWVTVSCTTTVRCTCTLPATKAGTDNLVMSVEGLTLSPLAVPDRFTFVAVAPTVSNLTPTVGPTKGGTKVTIRGSGFVGTLTVHFGTRPAKLFRVVSSSEIVVISPPGSGTAYVTVSASGLSSRTTAADRYTFVAAPTVTGLTPASGPSRGGTKVTIRGSGFVGTLTVHFGTRPAKLFRVVSSSEIVVISPPGSGTVYVTVSAAGGSSRTTGAGRYRYQTASLMRRSGRGLAP
ncbi:MAG: IPT/TIG domain-containing protein [Acidimicrobiales bacterium]